MVEDFERAFAEFCSTRYCVGVSSGTDALRFALMAAGIGNGDSVVTVPNTFIATTEAISQAGALPEFIDIDEHTYNMDVDKLRDYLENMCSADSTTGRLVSRRTGKRVAAIIPVHLYGQMADMDPILALAEKYNLVVIEDACQAHGAQYFSKRQNRWCTAGSMGRAAAFSFYPGKNLGACGEAGAVTTNDEELARKIRMLRDHGQAKKYYHEIEGYNGRLDAIQAGILRIKLEHLAGWNEKRRNCARALPGVAPPGSRRSSPSPTSPPGPRRSITCTWCAFRTAPAFNGHLAGPKHRHGHSLSYSPSSTERLPCTRLRGRRLSGNRKGRGGNTLAAHVSGTPAGPAKSSRRTRPRVRLLDIRSASVTVHFDRRTRRPVPCGHSASCLLPAVCNKVNNSTDSRDSITEVITFYALRFRFTPSRGGWPQWHGPHSSSISQLQLLEPIDLSRILGRLLALFDVSVSHTTLDLLDTFIRKLAHLTEYAIFALLLYRSCRGRNSSGWRPRLAFWCVVTAALYSVTDEYHQSFTPNRVPSALDCVIDITGAAVGMLLAYCAVRKKGDSVAGTAQSGGRVRGGAAARPSGRVRGEGTRPCGVPCKGEGLLRERSGASERVANFPRR